MADLNMPTISGDADWLDLADGEQGVVHGRLHSALKTGAMALLVSTQAWELIAIDLPDGYDGEEQRAGRCVTVLIERTEDGLQTRTCDIEIKEEVS